jgi:hypothetical protein
LNALGICKRDKTGGTSDKWLLHDAYRDIMVRFDHIEMVNESLDGDDTKENYNQSWGGEPYRESEMASLEAPTDDYEISHEDAIANGLFEKP